MKKKILFVCIGSTCRSPVAKAIVAKHFSDRFEADNAGISASQQRISPHSATVIREVIKLDDPTIAPKKFSSVSWQDFDFVIALDSRVYDFLRERFDIGADKLKLMHINDPFGKDLDTYTTMAAQIHQNFESRIQQLLSPSPIDLF